MLLVVKRQRDNAGYCNVRITVVTGGASLTSYVSSIRPQAVKHTAFLLFYAVPGGQMLHHVAGVRTFARNDCFA